MLLLLVIGSFHALAQTREIYVNRAFDELTKTHEKLAILPFKAIIKLRPREMERMTPQQFN
ncbi:MAG: hypothetical protein RI909_1592, partial [Bacteroidota bacterium]